MGRIDDPRQLQNSVNPSVAVSTADFDGDFDIDGRDFLAWQRGFGTPNAAKSHGDADNDTNVDGDDLTVWQLQYGRCCLLQCCIRRADPLAADLVDLALAGEWLGRAEVSPRKYSLAKTRGGRRREGYASLRDALMPVSKSQVIEGDSDMQEAEQADESWLSDALLERVFD